MANYTKNNIKGQMKADPSLSFSLPAWAIKEKIAEIEEDPRTILEKFGYSGENL